MKKVYHYLYYRAFDLVQLTGNYDLAWGVSNFLVILLALFLAKLLSFFKDLMTLQVFWVFSVSMFLILHVINYFVVIKDKKYLGIVKEYAGESKVQKRVGRLVGIMAIIVLVYSLF